MSARQVRAYWKRIDAWLDYRVPRMWLESPGLSENEIRNVERRFGHRLPEDVRESYKIHNGLVGVDFTPNPHFIGYLLPLVRPKKTWPGIQKRNAIESWESWLRLFPSGQMIDPCSRPRGPIERVFWSPSWLPLFDSENGDYVFLDMNPPQAGVQGQLIEFWRADGPKRVLARGLGEWLEKLAGDLENDRYHMELGTWAAHLTKMTEWRRRRREENRRLAEAAEKNQEGNADPFRAFKDYLKTPKGRAYLREQKKNQSDPQRRQR